MIKKLEISGVHMTVGDDLRRYVTKKIGRLEKYIPKNARQSAHIEVRLKEDNSKNKNERICEVVLHLPHEVITIVESTVNMYAAVDITEKKLKNQLHKYKEKHAGPTIRRRLMGRFKQQPVTTL